MSSAIHITQVDDESATISINGNVICEMTYDRDGSEGMRRLTQLARDIAEQFGIEVFEGDPGTEHTYTTSPGESIAGIALRQLGDESRWREIADLNSERFPDMTPHEYYPVFTKLKMPHP